MIIYAYYPLNSYHQLKMATWNMYLNLQSFIPCLIFVVRLELMLFFFSIYSVFLILSIAYVYFEIKLRKKTKEEYSNQRLYLLFYLKLSNLCICFTLFFIFLVLFCLYISLNIIAL